MTWKNLFVRPSPSAPPTHSRSHVADEGPKFAQLNGISLDLSHSAISAKLRQRIAKGFYEKQEAKCILGASQQGDRLLEIGGGIGYISSLAWRTGKFESVTVVEANPALIPIIEQNHRLNEVQAQVIHAAASADEADHSRHVPFYIRDDFWASSLSPKPPGYATMTEIPAIPVQQLIDELKPSFVVCDIEGGEGAIVPSLTFSGVRTIMIELHQSFIGGIGVKNIMDSISRQGFHYDQRFSCGGVVLFTQL